MIKDLTQDTDQIILLAYFDLEVQEKKGVNTLQPYIKIEPINDFFLKVDGMSVLIELAKKSINSIKIKEVKEMWNMWINEIDSFSKIKGFMEKLS